MKCQSIHINHFLDYINHNLPVTARKEVREHLEGCEDCRQLLEHFKAFNSIIEKEKKTEPNPFLATRIIEKIKNQQIQGTTTDIPLKYRFLRYMAAASLIVLGIFLGVKLGSEYYKTSGSGFSEVKTEYYVNDFSNEPIESFFINEQWNE